MDQIERGVTAVAWVADGDESRGDARRGLAGEGLGGALGLGLDHGLAGEVGCGTRKLPMGLLGF